MARDVLRKKILDEGYCCMYGYIKLCQARNQSGQSMADYLQVSPFSVWRQIRYVNNEKQKCQSASDCLKPLIDEITKEKGG